jgi:hypothetical protein
VFSPNPIIGYDGVQTILAPIVGQSLDGDVLHWRKWAGDVLAVESASQFERGTYQHIISDHFHALQVRKCCEGGCNGMKVMIELKLLFIIFFCCLGSHPHRNIWW